MTNFKDITINGVGTVDGGRCGKVSISGSGKIQGQLECEAFHVSGAGKVEGGGITVHGPIHCSGAGKVDGPVFAQIAKVSGSFVAEGDVEITQSTSVSGSLKTEGGLRCGDLSVSGVCKAGASICGNKLSVSGVLKTPADVQAESLHSSGALSIDGLLNAETVEIELNGDNTVRTIGGGRVLVRRKAKGFSLFGLQKRPRLLSELIEADEIDLEYTDCQTVRGVNVRIGPECVIDRVEYSGSLTTDPNCTVREKVKV